MKYDTKDSKHVGNSDDFTGKIQLILKLFIPKGSNPKLSEEIIELVGKRTCREIRSENQEN